MKHAIGIECSIPIAIPSEWVALFYFHPVCFGPVERGSAYALHGRVNPFVITLESNGAQLGFSSDRPEFGETKIGTSQVSCALVCLQPAQFLRMSLRPSQAVRRLTFKMDSVRVYSRIVRSRSFTRCPMICSVTLFVPSNVSPLGPRHCRKNASRAQCSDQSEVNKRIRYHIGARCPCVGGGAHIDTVQGVAPIEFDHPLGDR